MTQPLVVLTTTSTEADAQILAKTLVLEGLVACAQVVRGLESHYRWEGQLCAESECLLILKTLKAHWSALEARIGELHPYKVPEILGLEVERFGASYGAWLSTQVGDRG